MQRVGSTLRRSRKLPQFLRKTFIFFFPPVLIENWVPPLIGSIQSGAHTCGIIPDCVVLGRNETDKQWRCGKTYWEIGESDKLLPCNVNHIRYEDIVELQGDTWMFHVMLSLSFVSSDTKPSLVYCRWKKRINSGIITRFNN